ncbi:hypothetical protein [Streptomyces sp. NPDC102409]|uniref:hypothetical protein n=1 Tax=Streptomyces sp. NPDC102409 TaxID=3366172 RepID=UPI0037FEEBFE
METSRLVRTVSPDPEVEVRVWLKAHGTRYLCRQQRMAGPLLDLNAEERVGGPSVRPAAGARGQQQRAETATAQGGRGGF